MCPLGLFWLNCYESLLPEPVSGCPRIQLFGNLSAGLSVDNTQKNSAYHRGGSFVMTS